MPNGQIFFTLFHKSLIINKLGNPHNLLIVNGLYGYPKNPHNSLKTNRVHIIPFPFNPGYPSPIPTQSTTTPKITPKTPSKTDIKRK